MSSKKKDTGKSKKKKVKLETKVIADTQMLYTDTTSVIHCDKCEERIGIWRMVRQALFKKKGDVYYVKCPYCHYSNRRVKGEAGKELDERWKDLE
jgi:hypothetical protein